MVANSSFLDSKSFDGFKISVEKEFDTIYVIDLGSNVRKYMNDPNILIGEKNTIKKPYVKEPINTTALNTRFV